MTIDEINALERTQFSAALGWIFEDSPWVAWRAWERRPFASLDALHRAMAEEVAGASREEQLALLRAHPDLGSSARMSAASVSEQAGAGLDHVTPDFRRRNQEYRDRFGFPFLFAVKGATRQDIAAALEHRIGRTPEEEFAEALDQVYRIAQFRLEETIL